jgi:hypothetical protein
MNLALAPYLSVTGFCYDFFHCAQIKIQGYVYGFLIKGYGINCEGLKKEQSTRYCLYAVICQWQPDCSTDLMHATGMCEDV